MKIQFESDEFTTWTLREYMERAFGAQVNGRPFRYTTIEGWIRNGKVAEAYGGHKIYEVTRHCELYNVLTFRVEHLDRKEIEESLGSLDSFKETLNKKRVEAPKKRGRNKTRTEFYFKMLPERKRRGTVVPDNYADLGIDKRQLR